MLKSPLVELSIMEEISNAKRPYNNSTETRIPSNADVVDLTFDSDEEPPSKRWKSSSLSSTPAPQTTQDVKHKYTERGLNGRFDQVSSASATTSKPSVTTGASVSDHESRIPNELSGPVRHVSTSKSETPYPLTITNEISKSVKAPRTLSRGISDLTLSPSPNPQEPPGALPVADVIKTSNPSNSSVRPTALELSEIIDLDTDSDNAPVRAQKKIVSPSRLSRPKTSPDDVAPNFILPPEVRPILFDTQSPQPSPADSADAKSYQTTARSHNVPAQALLTQLSSQPSSPIVKSDVQPSRIPLANLGGEPFVQRRQITATSSPFKADIRINVPPTPSQQASKRRDMLTRLKQSTHFARDNLNEIDEVFGSSGFSKVYDTNLNEKLFQKAAQKKRKDKSKPNSVLLDFGKLILDSSPATAIDKTLIRHPRKQARDILNGRFKQQTNPAPLSFENRFNSRQLDGKFQFVDHYVLSKKIQAKKQQPFSPARQCQCLDSSCDTSCACSRYDVDDERGKRLEQVPIYHRRVDGRVVLTDEFINHWWNTVDIFECGQSCRCGPNCINRIAQEGRTIPLQIFETRKCGFGVRSAKDIVKGQFIDVYLGEVLTDEEVSKREAAAEEDTPSYVMTLDNFIRDPQGMFHVDGANFGSVMRFVNHSCNPNCKTYTVVLPGGSKHLYHIGFYAIKDIKAGTELTIDYDPRVTTDEFDEAEKQELDDDIVRCQCGEPNCRKRLWAKGKQKRARRKRLIDTRDD